jgi:hypothetical protein
MRQGQGQGPGQVYGHPAQVYGNPGPSGQLERQFEELKSERDAANHKLRQLVEVVRQDREQKAKEIEFLKNAIEEQVRFFLLSPFRKLTILGIPCRQIGIKIATSFGGYKIREEIPFRKR